jgi:hypothetical protein
VSGFPKRREETTRTLRGELGTRIGPLGARVELDLGEGEVRDRSAISRPSSVFPLDGSDYDALVLERYARTGFRRN